MFLSFGIKARKQCHERERCSICSLYPGGDVAGAILHLMNCSQHELASRDHIAKEIASFVNHRILTDLEQPTCKHGQDARALKAAMNVLT